MAVNVSQIPQPRLSQSCEQHWRHQLLQSAFMSFLLLVRWIFTAIYEFLGSLIGNTHDFLLKRKTVSLLRARRGRHRPMAGVSAATNQEHIQSQREREILSLLLLSFFFAFCISSFLIFSPILLLPCHFYFFSSFVGDWTQGLMPARQDTLPLSYTPAKGLLILLWQQKYIFLSKYNVLYFFSALCVLVRIFLVACLI